MSKQITNHSNFDADDYKHLSDKGYTNKEIIAIWNQDEKREAVQSLGDFMRARY